MVTKLENHLSGRVGSVENVPKFDQQRSLTIIENVVKSVSKTKECAGKLAWSFSSVYS